MANECRCISDQVTCIFFRKKDKAIDLTAQSIVLWLYKTALKKNNLYRG